jgi:hypothetical protein
LKCAAALGLLICHRVGTVHAQAPRDCGASNLRTAAVLGLLRVASSPPEPLLVAHAGLRHWRLCRRAAPATMTPPAGAFFLRTGAARGATYALRRPLVRNRDCAGSSISFRVRASAAFSFLASTEPPPHAGGDSSLSQNLSHELDSPSRADEMRAPSDKRVNADRRTVAEAA